MSSEGSREGRSSDSDLLVPSPSAATLHQISSLKDMLDQVNEENQQNIQKTREIESEIVIRDMSYNNISGEIPSGLPPSATFINLAANELVGNIPTSLPSLKNLKYLNVSNNSLFGVVGNAFTDMTRLEILDLSFNSFSGDLPSSFGSLKNLHSLYLQHNQFTGSIYFFANLPLTNLYATCHEIGIWSTPISSRSLFLLLMPTSTPSF